MILEPGWLMRTCHHAHISVMSTNSPVALKPQLCAETPIPDSEAAELFAVLDARFKAWTGRSLAEQAAILRE
jgi:hypothetical protein